MAVPMKIKSSGSTRHTPSSQGAVPTAVGTSTPLATRWTSVVEFLTTTALDTSEDLLSLLNTDSRASTTTSTPPQAFEDVRTELRLLGTSLARFASVLPLDFPALLSHDSKRDAREDWAKLHAENCVDEILGCCALALESLESYVERYERSIGGNGRRGSAGRMRKQSVSAEYSSRGTGEDQDRDPGRRREDAPLRWGDSLAGNICAMQDVLQIFVTTIDLTVEAIQR